MSKGYAMAITMIHQYACLIILEFPYRPFNFPELFFAMNYRKISKPFDNS